MNVTVDSPHDSLDGIVERLENAFITSFANWDQLNMPSAAHYFQKTYAETIRTLSIISEEEWKEDVDPQLKLNLGALFKRAVALLPMAIMYAKEARDDLWPVHKALLSSVRELGERRDVTGTNGLVVHIIRMYKYLEEIWPPARQAWAQSGTDLKPDSQFGLIYEEFCGLDNELRDLQGDYERYARNSWQLLTKAFQALHLPESELHPGAGFFNNDTRPTYVSFACNSKEFLYGKGKRPGILSVKARLGGPLTADQQNSLEGAAKMSNKKSSLQHPTRAGTERPYKMARMNAIADFQDVLRDSEALSPGDQHLARPGADVLVTPTWEVRREILVPHRRELEAIIGRIYKEKIKMPVDETSLPKTYDQRADWLRPIAEKIKKARAAVNHNMIYDNSSNKAKNLRLAAYELKLYRAIYMIGIFSGIPAARRQEVKDALVRLRNVWSLMQQLTSTDVEARLDDWILHEQALNAGDQHIMARLKMDKGALNKLQQEVTGREANIARWTEMKDQMFEDSGISLGFDDDDDDDGSDILNSQEMPEKDDPVLDKDTIRKATILLNSVLKPSLPDSSDYALDVREERRRRRWHEQTALARLAGDPTPQWTHKKVVDPFTAGGPPDWEMLPRESYWERLEYMWIMTHWRFYQLRELEL